MRTNQPVNNHEDLLGVVDGLLEEMGLDRRDTGGKVTFAGLDPLRPTVLKVGAVAASILLMKFAEHHLPGTSLNKGEWSGPD